MRPLLKIILYRRVWSNEPNYWLLNFQHRKYKTIGELFPCLLPSMPSPVWSPSSSSPHSRQTLDSPRDRDLQSCFYLRIRIVVLAIIMEYYYARGSCMSTPCVSACVGELLMNSQLLSLLLFIILKANASRHYKSAI